jgi:hypothetical protein
MFNQFNTTYGGNKCSKGTREKEHIDLYSLDLEKPFDKVKKQDVVEQRNKWKAGEKITKTIQSFLIN